MDGVGGSFPPDPPHTYMENDMTDVKRLTGQRLIKIRYMTKDELAEECWEDHSAPVVLEFSGGSKVYAMRDEEGNGPGCLVAQDGKTTYYVETEA